MKWIQKTSKKRKLIALGYFAASLLLTTVSMQATSLSRSDLFYPKHGLVIGKVPVLDPESGQPILVVVNEQGDEVLELGPQTDDLANTTIWSAASYRADVQAYQTMLDSLPSSHTQGHCIVAIENYGSEHCGESFVEVPAPVLGDPPVRVDVEYPNIYSGAPSTPIRSIPNVKYIVLRNSATISDPRELGPDGSVLLISRINPSSDNIDSGVVNDTNIRSVLLTENGSVHYSTEHNITYKTGYFEPIDDYDENRASFLRQDKERALGPIAGAKVFSAYDYSERFASYTDTEGAFRVEYYLPPCPCTTFSYDGDLWAEIPYKNYNPLTSEHTPFASFFTSTPTYDFCSGYHYCNLVPGSVLNAAIGINATTAISANAYRRDIKFDAMLITGEGELVDEYDQPIPIGETTEYSVEQQGSFSDETPSSLSFDFDLDRLTDQAVLFGGEYYVYLQGRTPEYEDGSSQPINEDFRRRPDQLHDYQDRGLLESISLDDLKETDLYIYRVSTGELIVERQNLKPEEYVRQVYGGVDDELAEDDDNGFYYKQMMRGPRLLRGRQGNDLSDWWSAADIRIELFDNIRADFLRMGEEVQIIAINRPTGYIGSTTAKLEFNTETGGNTLDIPIDTLKLRPPNLKIRAERRTEVELGLTEGEVNDYLIGSEGAGLTSDQFIVIKTEWFDNDGRPLPSDLPGYSGTLAKIVGAETLQSDSACTSSVSPITIQPGSRIQLLKLGDNCDLGTEHYYVYVCGHNDADTARDKCFSFDSDNTNDIGRPQYYVPVKVPFYDEVASRRQYNAHRYSQEDELIGEDVDTPEGQYRWHYRPEMQFSVYELEVEHLNTQIATQSGGSSVLDILNEDAPLIGRGTEYLDVIYNLLENENELLPAFGPDREFVFSLDGKEEDVGIGENQELTFENFDYLPLVQSEDLVTLRLFLNNDQNNVLWEYAFGRFYLFPERNLSLSDEQNEVLVSADDALTYLQTVSAFVLINDESSQRVDWSTIGNGTVSPRIDTATDGNFSTDLQLSTIAGHTAIVRAEFESGQTLLSPTYRIIPGQADSFTISQSGSTAIGGLGAITLSIADVEDQFGNTVKDGTTISVYAPGMAVVSDGPLVTNGGEASVDLVGSIDAGNIPVTVKIGDSEQLQTVTVHDIALSFRDLADTEINGERTVTIDATTTYAGGIDGVEIDVATYRGSLSATRVALSGDSATVNYSAGAYRGFAQMSANVSGTLSVTTQSFNVTEPGDYMTNNVLVTDGSGSLALTGGSIDYGSDTELVMHLQPGEVVTPTLADIFAPPVYPILDFNLDQRQSIGFGVNDGQILDHSYGINAQAFSAGLVSSGSHEFGYALSFAETGYFEVSDHTELDTINSGGINFWINIPALPSQAENLVNWDDLGLTLVLNMDGTLSISGLTQSGTVSVTTSTALAVGQWHQVAMHFHANALKLGLDGQVYQQALPTGETLIGTDLESFALQFQPSLLQSGLSIQAEIAGIEVYNWDRERALSFAGDAIEVTAVAGADGIARVPLSAQAPQLAYQRSYHRISGEELGQMLAFNLRFSLFSNAYAQTTPQDACLSNFTPIDPEAQDVLILQAERLMNMTIECFVKPRVDEARVQYETASGFRSKSVALVKLAVFEGAYRQFDAMRSSSLAIANCLDAALTGNNSSAIGFGCDLVTSFFAIGDIRDLLIQSWHYHIGDRNNYDALTAQLAAVGVFASGVTALTGGTGAPIAVFAGAAKGLAKTLRLAGPGGSRAGVVIASKIGKIMQSDLSDSQKIQALLRFSPLVEIGVSVAFVFQAEPELMRFFAQVVARAGTRGLDEIITAFDTLLPTESEVQEIARLEYEQRFPRWMNWLLPEPAVALPAGVTAQFRDFLRQVTRKYDQTIPLEKQADLLNEAIRFFNKTRDDVSLHRIILNQGTALSKQDLLRAYLNVFANLGGASAEKLAGISQWGVGNTNYRLSDLVKDIADLDLAALRQGAENGDQAIAGIKRLLSQIREGEGPEVLNFTKGATYHLAVIRKLQREGVQIRRIEVTDASVTLDNGTRLPMRRVDLTINRDGVDIDVELKNIVQGADGTNLNKTLKEMLGETLVIGSGDAPDELQAGQLLSDILTSSRPNARPKELWFSGDVTSSPAQIVGEIRKILDANKGQYAKKYFNIDLTAPGGESAWNLRLDEIERRLVRPVPRVRIVNIDAPSP